MCYSQHIYIFLKEASVMKAFFQYFFGKGDTPEFQNFTLAHFLPILLAVGVILLIYFTRDKIRTCKQETGFRYTLAFLLIICEMSYYWRLVGIPSLGPNPVDHLPITVCGWAVIFSSFMLIGKSQTLFDISYFWLVSYSYLYIKSHSFSINEKNMLSYKNYIISVS